MAYYPLVIIRGGGDLATGVVQKLHRAGIRLLVLESARPTAIRRNVALCDTVFDGTAQVEDIFCRLVEGEEQMKACHRKNEVPLMVDPEAACIGALRPRAVIDAIIAKRNLGTHRNMAPITIALGPGFQAGVDVDVVVETMRGHNLGRLIFEGTALPNTGVPGMVGGEAELRVIHAPMDGTIRHIKTIGDIVHKDEPLFLIDQHFITAPFTGRLRGLIRNGYQIPKGMKIADIDPRTDVDWNTISDKARALGGGALEAYLMLNRRLRAKK